MKQKNYLTNISCFHVIHNQILLFIKISGFISLEKLYLHYNTITANLPFFFSFSNQIKPEILFPIRSQTILSIMTLKLLTLYAVTFESQCMEYDVHYSSNAEGKRTK